MLEEFITKNRDKKIIIFTETKDDSKQFSNFTYAKFRPLHGDISQRQRSDTLDSYRRNNSNVILVATDVAARGLDIDDIDIVIQYKVRHVDSFVHRSGRTGRAGKSGMNIVFCQKNELGFFKTLE